MSETQTTRAEYHADSDARTVRFSRRAVRRALEAGHVGRENAIHGRELATFVPVAETTVRDVIAELRDDPDGPPIGNCGDGYYLLSDADELERYVESVKAEIATKRERMRANVQAFNRERYGE
jgi:predicted TIM-barrel enzyme